MARVAVRAGVGASSVSQPAVTVNCQSDRKTANSRALMIMARMRVCFSGLVIVMLMGGMPWLGCYG